MANYLDYLALKRQWEKDHLVKQTNEMITSLRRIADRAEAALKYNEENGRDVYDIIDGEYGFIESIASHVRRARESYVKASTMVVAAEEISYQMRIAKLSTDTLEAFSVEAEEAHKAS